MRDAAILRKESCGPSPAPIYDTTSADQYEIRLFFRAGKSSNIFAPCSVTGLELLLQIYNFSGFNRTFAIFFIRTIMFLSVLFLTFFYREFGTTIFQIYVNILGY